MNKRDSGGCKWRDYSITLQQTSAVSGFLGLPLREKGGEL